MSKRRSRKARKRFIRRVIAAVAVLAAVAAFFIAFRLKYVVVAGNIHNAPDEVTEVILRKPTLGNTVLAKLLNDGKKVEDGGFIDSLKIEIVSRDTIRAEVREKRVVGRINEGGLWRYIDNSGTVVASVTTPYDGDLIPPVEGLTFSSDPGMEERLPVLSSKPVAMLEMLLARCEIDPEMSPDKVVFNTIGEMSLIYGGSTVMLGDGEKLEVRLKELSAVLPQLMAEGPGTLHLENFDGSLNGLIFTPDRQ